MVKASLRDNILKAGLKVMFKSGYNGTGVRDIVAAAGAPQGSFTNHFRSKEAFACEVLFDAGDDFWTTTRKEWWYQGFAQVLDALKGHFTWGETPKEPNSSKSGLVRFFDGFTWGLWWIVKTLALGFALIVTAILLIPALFLVLLGALWRFVGRQTTMALANVVVVIVLICCVVGIVTNLGPKVYPAFEPWLAHTDIAAFIAYFVMFVWPLNDPKKEVHADDHEEHAGKHPERHGIDQAIHEVEQAPRLWHPYWRSLRLTLACAIFFVLSPVNLLAIPMGYISVPVIGLFAVTLCLVVGIIELSSRFRHMFPYENMKAMFQSLTGRLVMVTTTLLVITFVMALFLKVEDQRRVIDMTQDVGHQVVDAADSFVTGKPTEAEAVEAEVLALCLEDVKFFKASDPNYCSKHDCSCNQGVAQAAAMDVAVVPEPTTSVSPGKFSIPKEWRTLAALAIGGVLMGAAYLLMKAGGFGGGKGGGGGGAAHHH